MSGSIGPIAAQIMQGMSVPSVPRGGRAEPVGLTFNPGIGLLTERGVSGRVNPYHQAFQGFQQGGVNPFLRDLYQQGAEDITDTFNRDVLPSIHAGFSGAGRTGSVAHQNVISKAGDSLNEQLTDLSERLYGQAYETDRNRALQAAQYGGNLAQQEFAQQLQSLLGATGEYGAQEGRRIGGYEAETGREGERAKAEVARYQAQTARIANEQKTALALAGLIGEGLDRDLRAAQVYGTGLDRDLSASRIYDDSAQRRLDNRYRGADALTRLAALQQADRQAKLDAPFRQLAQYSSIVQAHPYISQRSSGSSKGGSFLGG